LTDVEIKFFTMLVFSMWLVCCMLCLGTRCVLFQWWLPVFELQWHCWPGFPRQDDYDLGLFHWSCFIKSDISGKHWSYTYLCYNDRL